MKENLKIDYSFIIPAYNEEEYLPKTLASLKESMNALGEFRGEIVVANNNSISLGLCGAGAKRKEKVLSFWKNPLSQAAENCYGIVHGRF